MGSNHCGELALGSGRTSRKAKKSTAEKPKQPQRGLGVAQLEKIRLQDQMASYLLLNKEEDLRFEMAYSSSPSSSSSSSLFGLHPNTMMGFGNNRRRDGIYGELQSSHAARSLPSHNNLVLSHHFTQSPVMLPLLDETMEDMAQKKRRHDRRHSTGSISKNSDSNKAQELDLDLKLSI